LFCIVIVGACANIIPSTTTVGSCKLELHAQVGGEVRPIDPPYVIEMTSFFGTGKTIIVFYGVGWERPTVHQTDPEGVLRVDGEVVPGEDVNWGRRGWEVDAPGSWHFRLTDEEAGCIREFDVEVVG
jgi:hypothetical protein